MTGFAYNLPMTDLRRIAFVLHDGFEILDMAGPAGVFGTVNGVLGREAYACLYLAAAPGEVRSSVGAAVTAGALSGFAGERTDTLLVVGSDTPWLRDTLGDDGFVETLARAAGEVGRLASVCTGAFLLARAGLLDRRSVTTHWAARRRLATRYPEVRVEDDALYVVDGRCWTSAGVTTGIDLALAMVREDHGASVMREAARRLVVYSHRPGRQSQFSPLLEAQTASGAGFSDLLAWLETRLDTPVGVPEMARRCAMSERTFHRKFTAAIGSTPAKFLEGLRLTRARDLIEDGLAVKRAARAVGFRSEGGFRAAFEARFGLSPSMHRLMHGDPA